MRAKECRILLYWFWHQCDNFWWLLYVVLLYFRQEVLYAMMQFPALFTWCRRRVNCKVMLCRVCTKRCKMTSARYSSVLFKFFSIILIRNNTNYFYAFLKTVLFLWVRDKQLFKCKIDCLMFCLSFYLVFHILLNTFNFLDTKVCLPTLYLFFVTFSTVVVFWGLLRNIY